MLDSGEESVGRLVSEELADRGRCRSGLTDVRVRHADGREFFVKTHYWTAEKDVLGLQLLPAEWGTTARWKAERNEEHFLRNPDDRPTSGRPGMTATRFKEAAEIAAIMDARYPNLITEAFGHELTILTPWPAACCLPERSK